MSLLQVNDISKAYRAYKSEWRRFASWLGFPTTPCEEHWVLKNISFAIEPGEAVGIVGQNGAGKSTLLKIITGTTQPTRGLVNVGGRIAAILELGMGFNPELTGRQNVYHSAGLMGFSYGEIHNVMGQIEDFAEIGSYFDEPVRTYSSGMQMRVAFSVATAFRPEILIVDEALSVGDAYFQHKCFSLIRRFQEQGTTLLIVSHDKGAIQALCNRAIFLENGRMIKVGTPEEVFAFYNAIIAEKEEKTIKVERLGNGKIRTASGTGEATLEEVCLLDKSDDPLEFVKVAQEVKLRVKVRIHQPIDSLVLGFGIKDRLGQDIYGTNTWHTQQVIKQLEAGDLYLFSITFSANFGVGSYSIVLALHDLENHLGKNYEWRELAYVFNVVNTDKDFFAGCNWLQPKIAVDQL